jgi:hypothetical protein
VLPIPAVEPVDVAPPAPKVLKLPRKRRLPEPEERITREPEVRDEPEEVVEVARVAKKPRRKKRKRPARHVNQELPTWAVWLISVGGFILIAGSIALGAILKGHGTLVLVYSVIMAVMLPISTAILIISMFITSWLGGGIEFGEAHVVIPKAVGLLLVVNTIGLLPFGGFIAFPIWVFGLMFLFGLDLWETRVLWLVNWGLNFFARMAVFGIVMAIFSHADVDFTPNHQSGQQGAVSQEAEAIDAIESLGGDCSTQNNDEDGPIVAVTLAGTRATDRDLAILKSFPKLRRLDLSATLITDAGLTHLKGLKQLETLTLTGTRVTNLGIADIQAALPRVRIVR